MLRRLLVFVESALLVFSEFALLVFVEFALLVFSESVLLVYFAKIVIISKLHVFFYALYAALVEILRISEQLLLLLCKFAVLLKICIIVVGDSDVVLHSKVLTGIDNGLITCELRVSLAEVFKTFSKIRMKRL